MKKKNNAMRAQIPEFNKIHIDPGGKIKGGASKDVSSILSRALKSYRLDKKIEEYSAFPEWREIIGEEAAKVAKVEKILRGKVLVIRVIDAAWAQELSMQKDSLMSKVNKTERGAIIEDIHFKIGNPKSFSQ